MAMRWMYYEVLLRYFYAAPSAECSTAGLEPAHSGVPTEIPKEEPPSLPSELRAASPFQEIAEAGFEPTTLKS